MIVIIMAFPISPLCMYIYSQRIIINDCKYITINREFYMMSLKLIYLPVVRQQLKILC